MPKTHQRLAVNLRDAAAGNAQQLADLFEGKALVIVIADDRRSDGPSFSIAPRKTSCN